jgi:hypothetical protein
MNKDLLELLVQRQKLLDVEITEKHWSKLIGKETEPGRRCIVEWNDWGTDYPDEGYLFDLPIGNSSDEADIFVHIPEPQNPDGIDTPPAAFLHLYDLMLNDMVKRITIK